MAFNAKQIPYMVITLVIVSALLPIGLGLMAVIGDQAFSYIAANGSTVTTTLSAVLNPTVLTLLTTVVPIMVVIGIALYFIPKIGNK